VVEPPRATAKPARRRARGAEPAKSETTPTANAAELKLINPF
jgi:hypothetical protein